MIGALPIDKAKLEAFCQNWRIVELSLFGSALRENYPRASDVDLLVEFESGARWTLFDLAHMEEDLERIFSREVDLVSRRGVEESANYIRRKEILESAQPIYASR